MSESPEEKPQAGGERSSPRPPAVDYKTLHALAEQIDTVRTATAAPFGVNVFVPQPLPETTVVDAYRGELSAEAERYGVALPDPDPADDDRWDGKIKLLTEQPVPVVPCGRDQATGRPPRLPPGL